MQANQNVRKKLKEAGIRHWQIAMHIGISEPTLCRWLRVPLSAEREKMILTAIDNLAKGGVRNA